MARSLREMVARREFASIVADRPSVYSYLPSNLRWYYCRVEALPKDTVLEPWTGTRTAPATVWMPRTDTAPCQGNGPVVTLPSP